MRGRCVSGHVVREGLGRRRTGARQGYIFVTLQQVSLKLGIVTILGSLSGVVDEFSLTDPCKELKNRGWVF